MPLCCVPKCENNTRHPTPGIKFFRFPPDEGLCKKWIKLIRRTDDFEWGMETRICSWHFPNGKEYGPTRFAWNVDKNFDLQGFNAGKKRRTNAETVAVEPLEVEIEDVVKNELEAAQNRIRILEKEMIEHATESEQKYKHMTTEYERKLLDLGVELDMKKYRIRQLENQLNLVQHLASESNKSGPQPETDLEIPSVRIIQKITPDFATDFQNWDSETFSSFTGLRDYSSFTLLVNMLHFKNNSAQKSSKILCLDSEKKVLLFLMKSKLDLPTKVLAKLFCVSSFTVSNVFNSILNFIFEMYYEGDGPLTKIPSRWKTARCLPKCFQDMGNCRIVLDCTEFTIEIPYKMDEKKITYSNYKSRHTMKVLIGCAPNGTAVFVSDLHGGAESDKSIVITSKLLDQMIPGDLILADKGFEIFDILPPGVALNIPSFLMNQQFTLNETLRNRSYARARIIIERLNAKLKVFKILDCIRASNRNKADRLVKVCVALTTLMPSLMDELNQLNDND